MMARLIRIAGFSLVCLAIASAMLLTANQAPLARGNRVPLVQDWSHRHLIYSHPKSLFDNLRLQQQARYAQQVVQRNFGRQPVGGGAPVFGGPSFGGSSFRKRPIPQPVSFRSPRSSELHRDWQVTMPGTGATMGPGAFPAKYTFDVELPPDCTHDFVVYTTSLKGGAAVDIYAVNNLYANTCLSGPVPTVLWAYHIQSQAGGAIGSPVLSQDGTQVAWVEAGGGHATLHILKPYTGGGDGTMATPNTPVASGSAAAYRACTPVAPTGTTSGACLFSINFGNGDDDTGVGGGGGAIDPSSPYYGYFEDDIFVGDNGGNLHEFTGVFSGNPAEAGGHWPIAIHTGFALTSPVYDETSQNVFVGDTNGRFSFAMLTGPGTCSSGTIPCLAANNYQFPLGGPTLITDGPIVDVATQRVFAFADDSNGVEAIEDDTFLTVPARVGPANLGNSPSAPAFSGSFDNAYYNSDTSLGTANGNLYVCGTTNGGNFPALYQIPMTAGTMGTPAPVFTASTTRNAACSDISEFYNSNSAKDTLFFSVASGGNAGTSCAGDGCVYSADVTSSSSIIVNGALPASGGASGIVVDNDSAVAGASNVYYTWLGNTSVTYPCNGDTTGTAGCAIQTGQYALGAGATLVQTSDTNNGANTTAPVFLVSATNAGDMILVLVHWDNQLANATVVDNRGDTYTALGPAINVGPADRMQAFYTPAIAAHPSVTVTANFSATTLSLSFVGVYEYTLVQTAPLDAGTYATNVGTTLAGVPHTMTSGPSGVTTAFNETVFGLFATSGSGAFPFTAGAGFTVVAQDATTVVETLPTSSEASYTATATGSNGGVAYGGIVVGFKDLNQ